MREQGLFDQGKLNDDLHDQLTSSMVRLCDRRGEQLSATRRVDSERLQLRDRPAPTRAIAGRALHPPLGNMDRRYSSHITMIQVGISGKNTSPVPRCIPWTAPTQRATIPAADLGN